MEIGEIASSLGINSSNIIQQVRILSPDKVTNGLLLELFKFVGDCNKKKKKNKSAAVINVNFNVLYEAVYHALKPNYHTVEASFRPSLAKIRDRVADLKKCVKTQAERDAPGNYLREVYTLPKSDGIKRKFADVGAPESKVPKILDDSPTRAQLLKENDRLQKQNEKLLKENKKTKRQTE